MKDIKQLSEDRGFLFKLVVAILCLISVIIWSCAGIVFIGYANTSYRYITDSSIKLYHDTMLIATGGYLIIMLSFIIIYIFDDTHHLFELLFVGCGAILNLVAGIIVIILTIIHNGNWAITVLSALMIASGVVMVFDFLREYRNKS